MKNAINIFNLENGEYRLSDIKAVYRTLASKYHPDKGGNTETMQLINNAFDELSNYFNENEVLVIREEHTTVSFDFIDELKCMSGVVIEVCGCWVWLTGNTYAYKEQISRLGFKFSATKKSWYWASDLKGYRRGTKSMKSIRNKFGSRVIPCGSIQILEIL